MKSPLDYSRVLGLAVLKGFEGYGRVFKILEGVSVLLLLR